MTFEEFYDDLVSNDLWFEQMQIAHKGKNIMEAARYVFTQYVAQSNNQPDIIEARRYTHNKLFKMPVMPVKQVANYQPPKEEFKLAVNTQEQEKEIDKLLEDYKQKLKSTGRPVPKMSEKEIQENGQVRPKAHSYPSTPESLVKKKLLHDQWIKECFDTYTGEPNEYYLPEDEWLKHQKQLDL